MSIILFHGNANIVVKEEIIGLDPTKVIRKLKKR